MKFVLVDIKNGKICGLYGGWSEKYYDMWNYIASVKIEEGCYKFDNLQDAIRVKNKLNGTGLLEPNFKIIVVEEMLEEAE